jgi:hypothetical protein
MPLCLDRNAVAVPLGLALAELYQPHLLLADFRGFLSAKTPQCITSKIVFRRR